MKKVFWPEWDRDTTNNCHTSVVCQSLLQPCPDQRKLRVQPSSLQASATLFICLQRKNSFPHLSVSQIHLESSERLTALSEATRRIFFCQEYLVSKPVRHLKLILSLVTTSAGLHVLSQLLLLTERKLWFVGSDTCWTKSRSVLASSSRPTIPWNFCSSSLTGCFTITSARQWKSVSTLFTRCFNLKLD